MASRIGQITFDCERWEPLVEFCVERCEAERRD